MTARSPFDAAVLVLAATFALAACKSEPERPPPDVDRKIVVASDLDHAPFIGLDALGKPVGRDVEMMEWIGSALELPIEWQTVPFQEVLPLVEVGAVDVGCATIGISPDRAERVAFTRPYFKTAIVVVVRAGENEPRSLADLARRRVACAEGTTAERAVRRLLPEAICISTDERDTSARERLLSGEIDAAAMDGPDAEKLIEESEGKLARLRKDLDQELYALALPFHRKTLLERIDRALEQMEQSGMLGMLDEKYGL